MTCPASTARKLTLNDLVSQPTKAELIKGLAIATCDNIIRPRAQLLAVGDEAPWNAVTYTPFLTAAFAQGTIEPMFSVAIVGNSSEGVLAWGGLPPVDFDAQSVTSTDLIIANLIDQETTAWQYSFYTIVPDGMRWGQTVDRSKYLYIIDTGTSLMYVPPRK